MEEMKKITKLWSCSCLPWAAEVW